MLPAFVYMARMQVTSIDNNTHEIIHQKKKKEQQAHSSTHHQSYPRKDALHKRGSAGGAPAALAQGRIQQTVKGVERRGQGSRASSDLIMPRATCAELIALCCVVCLLAVSRSDREYGCNLRKKKKHEEGREKSINEETKKTSTQQCTAVHTYISVHDMRH